MELEKKQGFFSALREEVARGLSPGRMRSDGPGRNASTAVAGLLPTRRWKGLLRQQAVADLAMPRSGSLRPVGEALAPLIEGPDPGDGGDPRREGVGWGQWIKGQLSRAPSVSAASASASCPRSDLRRHGRPACPHPRLLHRSPAASQHQGHPHCRPCRAGTRAVPCLARLGHVSPARDVPHQAWSVEQTFQVRHDLFY